MENTSSKESESNNKKEILKISDFFDFLKMSCQLNKAISCENSSIATNSLDYNKLAENVVVKNLTENSIGLHPGLETKLDGILKEGILDSIIPFMCPMQNPVLNVPQGKQNKNKNRDIMQSPRVGSLQILMSGVGKTKNDKTLKDSEKSIVVVQENNRHNKRKKSSTSVSTSDETKFE